VLDRPHCKHRYKANRAEWSAQCQVVGEWSGPGHGVQPKLNLGGSSRAIVGRREGERGVGRLRVLLSHAELERHGIWRAHQLRKASKEVAQIAKNQGAPRATARVIDRAAACKLELHTIAMIDEFAHATSAGLA
jgi:hypothetical protein